MLGSLGASADDCDLKNLKTTCNAIARFIARCCSHVKSQGPSGFPFVGTRHCGPPARGVPWCSGRGSRCPLEKRKWAVGRTSKPKSTCRPKTSTDLGLDKSSCRTSMRFALAQVHCRLGSEPPEYTSTSNNAPAQCTGMPRSSAFVEDLLQAAKSFRNSGSFG